MSNLASAIKTAEAALENGDYRLCIRILDPLLLSYSEATLIGAELRLLTVTAYMGKGEEKEAIDETADKELKSVLNEFTEVFSAENSST